LIEHAGTEIGRLLRDLEFFADRGRGKDPAATQSGREHFRERAKVDDAAVVIRGLDRSRVGVVDVHQLAVRIVFDDEKVVLRGQVQDRSAPRLRHQPSRWILKIRDHVEQLRLRPRRHFVERLRHDPVVILRHAGEFRAAGIKRRRPADVRRQFDEHNVAGIKKRMRDQVERLLRSRRDDDVLSRRVDLSFAAEAGDELTETGKAARRTVLQRNIASFAHHALRDCADALCWKRFGIR